MYATLDLNGTKIEERVEMSDEYNINYIEKELNYTYKHYNFSDYNGTSVVQGIELQGETFCAFSDPRKKGVAAAYNHG